ncbi:hypothetical protein [Streptomyces griseorubiginosus]|uniref:hypothetical protein n=1 Tax=Streptomyces griseorubiginosus TaxID=67304 RepID=UPI0036E07D5E
MIPPHHTLWLVAHKKGEGALNLLGRVHLTGPDTGPTIEIGAVLVPYAISDYLLGATTYTGVQLVPAKAGADVAGLVSTRLPPGTDTGGENCSS